MLEVKCDVCHKLLQEQGALLFAPPKDGNCDKYHICVPCSKELIPLIFAQVTYDEETGEIQVPPHYSDPDELPDEGWTIPTTIQLTPSQYPSIAPYTGTGTTSPYYINDFNTTTNTHIWDDLTNWKYESTISKEILKEELGLDGDEPI